MNHFKKTILGIALAVAVALIPSWMSAQQGGGRKGGNNPFPGGTNEDGSLRPTPPVTRLFSQDAYTEYAILAPGTMPRLLQHPWPRRRAPDHSL